MTYLPPMHGLSAILVLFAALLFSSWTEASDIGINANQNDLAISGYDPVAYFTQSKAVKGSSAYSASHQNAIYHFASAEHRNSFKQNPEKYAPQFGGYCAMGVALYKKLDVDPEAWYIEDGKLYLNLNKTVQKTWLTDVSGHIESAHKIWPDIKTQDAQTLNES